MIKGNYKLIKYYRTFILAFLGILLCVFLLQFFAVQIAYADDTQVVYSDVLEDLRKDSTFDVADYPNKVGDYSLQVIQIAESSNKELFVYVYQPSFCEFATSINISTASNGLEFTNYKLAFLSANATLYKYRVIGLTVSEDTTRYYTITSIYRPFNEDYNDTKPSGNNTINEVSYVVGKTYTFAGDTVSCTDIEYVTITDKFVGFCRYLDGWHFFPSNYDSCDSHFVAFSTDKPIDKLMSAEVYYVSQSYNYANMTNPPLLLGPLYGAKVENVAKLTYKDRALYEGGGMFGYKYSWDKIQTVADFIATETRTTIYSCGVFGVAVQDKLTDEALKNLQSKQWVLRFAETQFSKSSTMAGYTENYTIVGEVSLLRLQYETSGRVYDLGVVDNKQTGSDKPSNEQTATITWPVWLTNFLRILLWVVVGILLLVILIPLFPYIIKFLVLIFKYLFLAIWYILKYLALAIYWIFAWPFYLKK